MMQRLGNSKNTAFSALFTLFLAVSALASAGAATGCGDNGNTETGSPDAGQPGPQEAGGGFDAKPEATSPPPDTGIPDTGIPDEGVPCAAPTFSPPPGTFTSSVAVTITSSDPGAQIYYLTNGAVPTPTTGTAYSVGSPVNIATPGMTTLIAIASGPTCLVSAPTSGVYTIALPPNTCNTPAPTRAAGQYDNDFKLGLAAAPSTGCMAPTICYTLDGSAPSCSAGSCTGTSKKYDATALIAIDGTVTSSTTGQVTVKALACEAGADDGVLAGGATYTLKVGQPVLQGPAPDPAVHLYDATNVILHPMVSSTTSAATAFYSLDPNHKPSCSAGTALMALPATLPISANLGNQTAFVAACKPGYLASDVTAAAYTITLNPPSVDVAGGKTYDANQTVHVVDTANAETQTGAYVCLTADGTAPACAASGCAAGQQKLSHGGAIAGGVHANGTDLKAIACAGTAVPFAPSAVYDSTPYTLKLDPVTFSPPSGSPIPNGGSLTVNVGSSGTGHAYDFLCWSNDGQTVPDCACTKAGLQPKASGASFSTTIVNQTTLQAVGCLSTPSANMDVYLPSDTPAATSSYQSAAQIAAPAILPANGAINNPQQVTFRNSEIAGGASAYFCYTTSDAAPAINAGKCYAPGSTHGATTCTSAVTAPQDASTDGPTVSTSGTVVRAIACDNSGAKRPSAEATAVTYTLIAGDPTIVPAGATVNLGQAITITTKTQGAELHWNDAGGTPSCATGLTAHNGVLIASSTPDSKGAYEATYYAMGQETGRFTVVACKTNYARSQNTASTTFGYSVAAPTFTYPTGVYDDYLADGLSLAPGVTGTWVCLGSGSATPGCGHGPGLCTGARVAPLTTACNYTADVSGQPNVAPQCSAAAAAADSSVTLTALVCAPTLPATHGIAGSTTVAVQHTLQVSAVGMTSPVSASNLTAPTAVTFSLTQTTNLPDGDPSAGHTVNGATNHAVFLCASTDALPNQPASCADFAKGATGTPGNGWVCSSDCPAPPATCNTTPTRGGAGPTLTLPDVGESATYNVFACKDGMAYSHGSATLTFTPYAHTVSMTGAVADFVQVAAPNGEVIPADGAAAKAYVSWDADQVYVGFDKGSVYANADIVHFYVGGANVGTQIADTVTATGTAPLPANFNARYHVFWKFNGQTAGMDEWTGGQWKISAGTVTTKYVAGSTFVEFSVPRSALTGAGGTPYFLGGDNDTPGATGQVAGTAWPAFGTQGNTNTVWRQWQSEIFDAAYFPNDTKNIKP
jgi:hypothetical protein